MSKVLDFIKEITEEGRKYKIENFYRGILFHILQEAKDGKDYWESTFSFEYLNKELLKKTISRLMEEDFTVKVTYADDNAVVTVKWGEEDKESESFATYDIPTRYDTNVSGKFALIHCKKRIFLVYRRGKTKNIFSCQLLIDDNLASKFIKESKGSSANEGISEASKPEIYASWIDIMRKEHNRQYMEKYKA